MPTKQYIKKLNGFYLKDEEARSSIDLLANKAEETEAILPTKENKPNLFMAAFFDPTDSNKVSAFVSNNCVSFNKLNIEFPFAQRDVSFDYYNGKFYFVKVVSGTNNQIELWSTADFLDWNSETITFNGLTGENLWGPEITIFEDGSAVIVVCNDYGTTISPISGSTVPAFDQYIMRSNNIEETSFSNPSLIELTGATNRNHIDGQIVKIDEVYYLVTKDDTAIKTEIWSSTDLQTWQIANNSITNAALVMEGVCLIPAGDEVYFCGDLYTDSRTAIGKTSIDNFPNFSSKLVAPQTLKGCRHGRIIYLSDDRAKRIIEGLEIANNDSDFEAKPVAYRYMPSSSGYWNLPNLAVVPDFLYGIAGTHTIEITNPFGVDRILIKPAGNRGDKLTITHIDGVELQTPIVITNTNYANGDIIEIPINLAQRAARISVVQNYKNIAASDVTPGGDFTISSCYGHKVDNVVTLNLTITCNSGAYASEEAWINTIATLPEDFRPITQVLAMNNRGLDNLFITANGVIQGNFKSENGGTTNVIVTYLTDHK